MGDIVNLKLAGSHAFLQNTLQGAAFAAQAFNLKMRPFLHHHLRQLQLFRLIGEQMISVAQIGKHQIHQPLRGIAIGTFENSLKDFHRRQGFAAGNFHRNINFTFEKPVYIARRHGAVASQIRYRGLAIAIMAEPIDCRADDFLALSIRLTHLPMINHLTVNNQ